MFGYWRLDPSGLPTYEYRLDQHQDPRATYAHSVDPTRVDHYHQLGNDRINAVATNEGYVELMGQERGITSYDRFDPLHHNYAGGFSIIADPDGAGERVWNSAYRWRPPGAETRRVWGVGYFQTVTQYHGLRVTHRIVAPPGDEPMLIDEVLLENTGRRERAISHYEYWDVNRHQLSFQMLRTGSIAPVGDVARDQLNQPFDQVIAREGDVLRADFVPRANARPDPSEPASEDLYPAPIFLASLSEAPAAVYTDQEAFLGAGGITAPSAAAARREGELLPRQPATLQPATLVMRHDCLLPAGGSRRLRFAYGYLPAGKTLGMLDPWRESGRDPVEEVRSHWRPRLAYLAAPEAPVLSREIPWHAYYLLSATTRLDYFQTRVTPQGSAYLYLHGLDGAPRDQALFSLALTYLAPELARDNLRLIMGMTRAEDGGMAYAYHGHGVLEGAIIHNNPSDLDLFFLLALHEYLTATGQHTFLDEEIPFYPREAPPPTAAGSTVLDHVRVAVAHLIDGVGRGPNGLVRVGDGDWDDNLLWSQTTPVDLSLSIASGESIPNTQMALLVLPQLAALLEGRDPQLAQRMRGYAQELRPALAAQFNGRWFLRAYLRDPMDKPVIVGADTLELQAQLWGLLIDDLLTTPQRLELARRIHATLASPLGPPQVPGGVIMAALGQLMTWAYATLDPPLAWEALRQQSLASKAEAFPAQWSGIWSAPDGFHSTTGLPWQTAATPMTDWPVMNMNPHSMFLLGALRVAGVAPRGRTLRLQPRGVPASYTLDLPLLRLEVTPGELRATYRAQNDGAIQIELAAPAGARLTAAALDGQPLAVGAAPVLIPRSFRRGDSFQITCRWR